MALSNEDAEIIRRFDAAVRVFEQSDAVRYMSYTPPIEGGGRKSLTSQQSADVVVAAIARIAVETRRVFHAECVKEVAEMELRNVFRAAAVKEAGQEAGVLRLKAREDKVRRKIDKTFKSRRLSHDEKIAERDKLEVELHECLANTKARFEVWRVDIYEDKCKKAGIPTEAF
jgi:hypothetical protein